MIFGLLEAVLSVIFPFVAVTLIKLSPSTVCPSTVFCALISPNKILFAANNVTFPSSTSYTVPSAIVIFPVVAVTLISPSPVVLSPPAEPVCVTPVPPINVIFPVPVETNAPIVSNPPASRLTFPEPSAVAL
ncbi:hypothetical protein ARAQ110984_03280 [Arcobacter aquimarinus]